MPKSTEKIDVEEFEKSKKKPLVKYSDMPTEMGNEAVEVCTMALDKFNVNRDYESASGKSALVLFYRMNSCILYEVLVI